MNPKTPKPPPPARGARNRLTYPERKKADRGKCIIKFCRGCREPNGSGGRYFHCRKHRWYRQKSQNPHSIRYHQTKQSAKRRGIQFNLSWVEFRTWAEKHLVTGLTIDRIDPEEPYQLSNLRALSASLNSKWGAEYAYAKKHGESWPPPDHPSNDPF